MQKLSLFVVHSSELTDHRPNGAGWIAWNYLSGLAERGHTIHVATPRAEMRGPVPPGLHVHRIPSETRSAIADRIGYMIAVRRLFARLSESVRFDLAQQFTPVQTGLSFSMLGTGVPLVLGPYSGYWPPDADGPPRRPAWASSLWLFARDVLASLQQMPASALVITCPAAIERIGSRRARETRVHVISHGIDSRVYRERDRLPGRQSILFLANLEYRKGIFTLLDAFDRVAPALPGCTLDIWGDGTEAAAVDRRIGQSPFRGRIFRRGSAPRERVAKIMRSHCVYCMPSHGEPFGMTLLEAMSSGVPVVTTNAGGPPYFVHEAGGRIVPMRDAARLADALVEILSSRPLQQSMGRYNRRRVEQDFDWTRQLDRMESVYAHVLNLKIEPGLASVPDGP